MKDKEQDTIISKYQAAINDMANTMFFNECSSDKALKRLNELYPSFIWHYSKGTGKIWHTIKIKQ